MARTRYFHGREIMALHNQGMAPSEIAAQIGITTNQVRMWMWNNRVMMHPERKKGATT